MFAIIRAATTALPVVQEQELDAFEWGYEAYQEYKSELRMGEDDDTQLVKLTAHCNAMARLERSMSSLIATAQI